MAADGLSEGTRTLCRIIVRKSSVEIIVVKPDGIKAGPSVEGTFEAVEVVRDLGALPHGDGAEVQRYGRALFDLLFADDEVYAAFLQCEQLAPDAWVQVRIELQDKLLPALRNLRWEYLCDQTQPNPRRLAVEPPFRLLRRLSSAPVVDWRPFSGRPRVLVVISNPRDLESFQTPEGYTFKPIEHPLLRQETKALNVLLESLKTDKLIADYQILGGGLDPPHPRGFPSLTRIRQVLEKAREAGRAHHIIHFLAHGYLAQDGQGHLILTGDGGKAKSVVQGEFRNLLPPEHQVRLVVFAACQSDEQALGRPLAGLAPSMLQRGVNVPAVIAMQDEISVGAAARFAEAFYRDLGRHGYIDTAMAHARAEVAIGYPDEWGIPVLYLQNELPRLFDPKVSLSARKLTSALFAASPLERFVNRETDIAKYTNLLCEGQAPAVCWLWGLQGVGKQTLLQQLRSKAYERGYGHLMVADRSRRAMVETGSKTLYQLLSKMLKDQQLPRRLDQHLEARKSFAEFWQDRTANQAPHEIALRFLDGLEEFAGKLERGIVCFFYFRDFEAHRNFLLGRAFEELIYAVADRYETKKLGRVRFMIATATPADGDQIQLFPAFSRYYFYEDELSGLKGPESVKELCRRRGLSKDGQVPSRVLNSVQQQPSWSVNQVYLPGPPAFALDGLAGRLDRGAPLDSLDIKWVSLNGAGGGR